ncbi:PD40 domain-containing protein [Phototrophicus methaneseepsis]|uniref:PD40 domain-containing protein n=1 Tax=Phototrophicus methaneseepsis TaxID=2710758 RepID=A0A7S8ECW3_9CHLR|nr:PD40 domain-containing protein [Phototrophicus methaneseepsis]QPC84652.1 PD40 domain-containing protein [Phototrophicus methaneseepsis]
MSDKWRFVHFSSLILVCFIFAVPAFADDADTTPVLRLSPVWSPNGQQIAYMATDGIHVIGVDGENDHIITPPTGFLGWTPDSTSLLISENQYPTALELWAYPIDGSEPVQLFPEIAYINTVAYSHDGERVAISGREADDAPNMIWLVNTDGNAPVAIAELSSFALSWNEADDAIIAQTRLEDDEHRLTDATVTITATTPYEQYVEYAADDASTIQLGESTTGEPITFDYSPEESYAGLTYQVTAFRQGDEVLAEVNALVADVAYSAESQAIAYIIYCDPARVSDAFLAGEWSADEQAQIQTALYILDTATAQQTEAISCDSGSQFSLAFSPDGQTALFIQVEGDQWDLYLLDIALLETSSQALENLTR